jgi:flagellar assembly factor FliW
MLTLHVSYGGQAEELEVAEEDVLTFPNGLVGCNEWRRFVLLSEEEVPGLHILQSLDEPLIHFLVTDPRLIEPTYAPTINVAELRRLGLAGSEAATLLCILTTHGHPPHVTANLLGPLVINLANRTGVQVVLLDAAYSTRHQLAEQTQPTGEAVTCSY